MFSISRISQRLTNSRVSVKGVRCMSGDRLHDTDIAFKPAESGWGGGSKYSKHFDSIFGNKNNDNKKDEKPTEDKKDIEKKP